MNRLQARVRKVESIIHKQFPVEKRPSAFHLALNLMSVDDLYLLREDLTLRRDGREAELTDAHRAANARLEAAIADLEGKRAA